jgi:adenylyltransferase/sulfurtransferase
VKKILTESQKKRYSRQILSPSIGEAGQEKLSKVRVLQIGAGGLGSPFALYIVAAGIKELTIIDNDILSISNLQRQILYNEAQVGKGKVHAAKEMLSNLNSEVEIKVFNDYVDENSIKKYVKDKDFIVDCSDNFKTKFLVNEVAVNYGIKAVIAGIKDFFGQIITINPKKTACYECVFNRPNQPNNLDPSEGPLPVIGVTPGILGTLEALEVIKTTLGLPNLENKLLIVNLLDLMFNTIDIVKSENCMCSK